MAEQQKFPSEVVDLPSKGKLYPEDSPLRSGKIELKYMTAREEDILTSQNLINKGLVIDKLLNALILTNGVNVDDLVLGDKNAIMVAARILAYGPEYTTQITDPNTGEKFQHTFNLADCPFRPIPDDIDGNEFEMELPISKTKVRYKMLTGKEESEITKELESLRKTGTQVLPELTTRLRKAITSVDGETTPSKINNFVHNMLSRDSLFFRQEMLKTSPDIDLSHEIEMGGEMVKVDIPMTINFFWPNAEK